MKITIDVTEQDIEAARRDLAIAGNIPAFCCPIAQSLHRTLDMKAAVSHLSVLMLGQELPLPAAARDFILQFDSDWQVTPFSFEIEAL
jgi:hypothetical protein